MNNCFFHISTSCNLILFLLVPLLWIVPISSNFHFCNEIYGLFVYDIFIIKIIVNVFMDLLNYKSATQKKKKGLF